MKGEEKTKTRLTGGVNVKLDAHDYTSLQSKGKKGGRLVDFFS